MVTNWLDRPIERMKKRKSGRPVLPPKPHQPRPPKVAAKPPPPIKRKETRGERNIRWCHENLFVPEGQYVGQELKLAQFMQDDFKAIYDNVAGTRRAIFSRGRKNAKDLALDTPIPTPQGWRTIADIEPGDEVYGSDGKPTRVLAVSEIFINNPCYAVGFSDGSSIVVGGAHLWTTRHRYRPWHKSTHVRSGNGGRPTVATVTTEQIAQSVRQPRADEVIEYNHKLKCAPALECKPMSLPIPPYTLGYWLGNGTSASSEITAGRIDAQQIAAFIHADAVGNVRIRDNLKRAPTIMTTRDRGGTDSLITKLRATELLDNKHIPDCYFDAGLAQRWTLLQGLMDSDGTVNRCGGQTTARCSYSSSKYRLAYDVWRLIRSLGLKAAISEGEAKFYSKSYGPYWKVEFAASSISPVFRLARKQSLLPRYLGKRSRTLTITSCEKVESVPTKCLKVDANDHLFLVGHGCVPTHNTTECAMIVLLHLCGPEAKYNSSMYSCAQSRDQAAVLFALAAKMIRMSPDLRDAVIVKDGVKELVVPELGTKFKALSAEVSTAYGLSPVLTIFDELGQCRGPRSPLYEAMETATGAQKNPLTIIISTQAPTDADLLSILIDDALAGHDPRVVCKLATAPKDADPFARSTIAMANPALGMFLNETEVMAMAEDARRMPSREAEFRNLVLNQRVEASNPFVTMNVWKGCSGTVADLSGQPCYAGLDLSEVNDLTAFVIIALIKGKWHVKPTFWLPEENIFERARTDRVPYDQWANEGFLNLVPGNSISYELIAPQIFELCQRYNVKKCAFDRWGFKYLKPWLIEAGFSPPAIEQKFVEFGQGTASMSPALRDLESTIRDRKLVHDDHPILSMCMLNAVVEGNDTGKDSSNRKLSKRKSVGRIDGAVALAMAFGTAPLRVEVDISTLIA